MIANVRVCMVSHYFAPSVGGVETHTDILARALAEQGCRVSVATWTPGSAAEGLPYKVWRRPSTAQFWRCLTEADIVHFNTLNPLHLLLAKLLGKKTLWAHFDYPTICPVGVAWWKGRSCSFGWVRCSQHLRLEFGPVRALRMLAAFWLRRLAAGVVDLNVFASAFGMARSRAPRAQLVPLGIPRVKARAAGNQSAPPVDGSFLFYGRHIAGKGGDLLLQALRLLREAGREATLSFCGTGPENERWRALSDDLGLDGAVAFKGYVRKDGLWEEMASASAVVVPSLHDEYFGLAALEAMSAGKAVIASDAGGLAEIVGEAGLLFEPGNAADLADKMMALLDSPELRRELEERARRIAREKYSAEMMGQRYLEVYRWLLRRS